jgi:hypothetical protein
MSNPVSKQLFEKLLADLRDEFRPSGRMENDIVFDLAHLRWQKYRLHKMHMAAAYGDPSGVQADICVFG